MIIKQILGAFLTGFGSIFVMFSCALSFYQKLSNLNTQLLAAIIGVPVVVITIMSITKTIFKYLRNNTL